MSELLLILGVLVESLLIWSILVRDSKYRLRGFITVNMILVSLFSQKLMTVFGLTANVGCIFYGTVFVSQYILYSAYGEEEAKTCLNMVLFNLATATGLSFLLLNFPTVIGNETSAMLINGILSVQVKVVVASYLAFYISQVVFIKVLHWLVPKEHSYTSRYFASVFISQLVDSFLFFSIAFSQLPFAQLGSIIVSGYIIKMVVALLFTPLLFFKRTRLKHLMVN